MTTDEPPIDSDTVAASAQGALVGRTSFPHPGPTGIGPPFISECECRCGRRADGMPGRSLCSECRVSVDWGDDLQLCGINGCCSILGHGGDHYEP